MGKHVSLEEYVWLYNKKSTKSQEDSLGGGEVLSMSRWGVLYVSMKSTLARLSFKAFLFEKCLPKWINIWVFSFALHTLYYATSVY